MFVASQAAAPPAVKVMVVSRAGNILRGPRLLRARRAQVVVKGRRCGVGAGTALAALEQLGEAVSLRDYGRCSSRTADSSQLFVQAVGGERNSGRDGWVYKLNGRVASVGAADPAGAFAANSTLTWFYCKAGPTQRCQRTLAMNSSSRRVGRGGQIGVRVAALDDGGRSTPGGGVLVSLGGARTRTARDGSATIVAPRAPGSYALYATYPGLVQAMPLRVRVR